MSEIEGLTDLYGSSLTTQEWKSENQPNKNLIYYSGVNSQCKDAEAIARLLDTEEPRVVSSHRSKSVKLPVIAFRHIAKSLSLNIIAVFRNNFHNLCCQIISTHDIVLPFHDVLQEVPLKFLEDKRARALEYHKETSGYKSPYANEEAERRYVVQMETDGNWEWYEKFTGDKVFKFGCRYFLIYKGWFEGFPCGGDYHSRTYYTETTNNFSFVARSLPHMTNVIYLAFNSAAETAYKEENNETSSR